MPALTAEQVPDLMALAALRVKARQHPPPPTDSPALLPWLQSVTPRWTWTWPYQRAMQAALERVTAGELKRVMFFLPPRHTKSETVTVRYPVYRLERDPTCKIIVGAYNQFLANKFSRKARRLAEGRLAIAGDRAAVEEWETPAGGGLRAVGVGGGVTGQGGDLILIDDPVKNREEAESATYRDRVWDWYTDDLYTRLEPNGAIILIMTRWHVDDLAGRLLAAQDAGGEAWHVVSFPALAEPDDPLGRAVGEALCPARYDEEALARIRAALGELAFASLYQQRPVPAEGALFKRAQFTVEPPLAVPPGLQWARLWDLAASTRASADYTASAAVALDPKGDLWVRDMLWGRWEWPDVEAAIIAAMLAEPNTRHGVEKALHGLAAVQDLRRKPQIAHIALRAVDVDKDKYSRALAWSTRTVHLVAGAWVEGFLAEVLAFPFAPHDDRVDTVSGGVQMLAQAAPGAPLTAGARAPLAGLRG